MAQLKVSSYAWINLEVTTWKVMESKMDNILGYYVFDQTRGWLQDDEKTWGDFDSAQEFTDAKLANDIGKRQSSDKLTFYVMACIGSI